MTVQRILKEIETQPLPRVLFVHGSETVWHDRIFAALKKRNAEDSLAEFNWSLFYGEKEFDLEPLVYELGLVPWGAGPKIVVLKNAELIPAAVMDKLTTWLQENPEANHLSVFLTKVDKRLKYVKVLRQFAREIECEPLQGERLLRHVIDSCTEQGKTMKRNTAELFLSRVGTDLLLIQHELEKLLALSAGCDEITAADVQDITSLAPGQVLDNTVFQMTDYIVQEKREEALDTLNLLLGAGEAALRILPLIERQLRLVLAATTTTASLDDTAKQMGESNSYALKKIHAQAQKYDLRRILAGFEAVLHADHELKLGVPGEQVLTDLIIKLT